LTTAASWTEKTLHYRFRDSSRLDQALTHRSVGGKHNERLEFLGDAVLALIIAENLYRLLPEAAEGYLTRLRARLVRKETLAEIGIEIRLGDWLKLGPGELKSGGFRRASILANGVEAILGAVYLDGGLDEARRLVGALYADRLNSLPAEDDLKDPKTRLQERLQAEGQELPSYAIESMSGEAHRRHFTVSCTVAAMGLRTEASARSRREAEQKAAEAMIAELDHV
jgi:ribonuclease-3